MQLVFTDVIFSLSHTSALAEPLQPRPVRPFGNNTRVHSSLPAPRTRKHCGDGPRVARGLEETTAYLLDVDVTSIPESPFLDEISSLDRRFTSEGVRVREKEEILLKSQGLSLTH